MKSYSEDAHINVGSGEDVTIFELARFVCEVVGFEGKIVRDPSKPDGTPRKVMDSTRLHALGWRASTPLRQGIAQSYADYLAHAA